MNKMTKGALATGLGVALLVGGGGTLAVWNAEAKAPAGTVASGDLNISAAAGAWTNAKGDPVNIASYKVVPGDVLTFTQDVTVTLVGELMEADLTVTNPSKGTKIPLEVGDVTLTDKADKVELTKRELLPADSGTYTAAVTVTLPETVTNRDYVNAAHALGEIGFKLDQIAP